MERPVGRKAAKHKRKETQKNKPSTERLLLETTRKNDLIEVHNATRIFEKDLSKIDDDEALEYFTLLRGVYLGNLRKRIAGRSEMEGKKKKRRQHVLIYNDDDDHHQSVDDRDQSVDDSVHQSVDDSEEDVLADMRASMSVDSHNNAQNGNNVVGNNNTENINDVHGVGVHNNALVDDVN